LIVSNYRFESSVDIISPRTEETEEELVLEGASQLRI